LEFIFLGVLLFFVSCVNYVNVCAIFLVNCVLGLAVSPEEDISSIFMTMEKVLVNVADISYTSQWAVHNPCNEQSVIKAIRI
jgi:hypothetical protein